MKFEEILEQLRNGKQVRRKGWADCLVEFDKYGNLCFVRDGAFVHYIVDLEDSAATDWEIYHEPILTDKEREYLSAVIKPFRDKVKCIQKIGNDKFRKILIRFNDYLDDFKLPFFEVNEMYINMEADKEYTLKELGL